MTQIPAAKPASTRRPGIALAIAAIVIALFIGGFFLWRSYQAPPVDRYSKVLEALKNHQIPFDDRGRVDLSKQFPNITGHNDAYVTYRDDGTFIVMFPTWYGQGQQVAGLIYTSRPLTDLDLHGRTSAINFEQKLVEAGSYEHLLLDKRINENWYQVSYKVR